jgi:hypothetical protein
MIYSQGQLDETQFRLLFYLSFLFLLKLNYLKRLRELNFIDTKNCNSFHSKFPEQIHQL